MHVSFLSPSGEKLVNFMVEPKKGIKWPKDLTKFKSRSDAIAVCKELCSRQFMHRSEKVAKGELEVRHIFFNIEHACLNCLDMQREEGSAFIQL